MIEQKKERPWEMGLAVWIATGAWVGFFPWMPGTIGALWGIPLSMLMAHSLDPIAQGVVIVAMVVVGIPICTAAARRIGRKDPGSVVWDEIATVPITFFLVPVELMTTPWVIATGFGLHRLFDISKAPPANKLESLPDGTGIMLDDCVAGVYSCLSLHLLLWLVKTL